MPPFSREAPLPYPEAGTVRVGPNEAETIAGNVLAPHSKCDDGGGVPGQEVLGWGFRAGLARAPHLSPISTGSSSQGPHLRDQSLHPRSHSSRAQPFTPSHHPSLLNLLSRGLCLSLCLSCLSITSPTQEKSILLQPPNHTLPPISPLFKPFYRSLQTDLKVQNFNIKSRLFNMKIRPPE